jgi:hypothetical protein
MVDTVLQEVSILSTAQDPEDGEAVPFEEEFLIPIASLSTNEPGTAYVAFKNVSGTPYPSCSFTNMLKFTSKEIDPSTGEPDTTGYDDEYEIEGLEIGGTDYVVPAFAGSWESAWEGTAKGEEAKETLVLSDSKTIAGKLFIFVLFRKLIVFKMLSHYLSVSSSYSHLMVVTYRSLLRHTHSSFTANLSRVAR